uniref:Cupin type-1 domain-containing protein n=1 Tax=Oryza glumipatula TaxID=40148 RepID=A0A0E0BA65_9ORYZ
MPPPPPSSRLLALLSARRPPSPLRRLLQIHAHLLAAGLLQDFSSLLAAAYALSTTATATDARTSPPSPLRHALALLSSLPASAYNAAIRALSLSDDGDRHGHGVVRRCLPLYRALLRSGTARPDHLTFPFLLKACARLREWGYGDAALAHVLRLGLDSDVFVVNAATHFLSIRGPMEDARRLFDRSPVRDLVSWNTLIGGYVRRGNPAEALELFWRMVAEDAAVRPDEVTMIAAVSGGGQMRDLELGRRLHGFMDSNGVSCTVRLMNALMDMYIKCGSLEMAKSVFERIEHRTVVSWTTMIVGFAKFGLMDDARKVFDEMPERDVFPWNALMTGYVQCKQCKEALSLFHEMQEASVVPDEITMVNLLTACSQLGALEMGMWVHRYIEKHRLVFSVALGTSLIDMYAKCGNIEKAIHIFKEIPEKNALTWTAMICGLANHGHANEAIEHFRTMIELGQKPDEITFIGVLSACCHAGLVKEGREFFSLMETKYHLERKMKHYSCMIDLLGRAGHLDEAEQLVNTMPMEPDAVVWGAIFFACRMQGNISLGEKAAMKLVEIDPSDSGIYVLLANMYAEANMRKKADKVRAMMRHLGVEKVPGCSCIELNGVVHEFIVKDKSHMDSHAIYDCLHEITLQIKHTADLLSISAAGRGITGPTFPGCPETYQQQFQQSGQAQLTESQSQSHKFKDEHQKIHRFRQGDVIALPAGVAHWCYNDGEVPVVAIYVTDINNGANQLDPRQRDFLLAGNKRNPQAYRREVEEWSQNIFSGFSTELLSEAFGISNQVARQLQCQNDQRGEIVRVERGLSLLQPYASLQEQEQGQMQSREHYQEGGYQQSQYGSGCPNGLDETFCTMRVRQNIDNPNRADTYNPRAGRVTNLNSQNFPILNLVQMSAVKVNLYQNALLSPFWNINAHSIVYITQGRAQVQVVNNNGKTVFNGELRRGQLLIVPQHYVVVKKAQREGCAYIAFKTNPNSMVSHIAGKSSIFRALPTDVLANAYRISREEAQRLKHNRGDEFGAFTPLQYKSYQDVYNMAESS